MAHEPPPLEVPFYFPAPPQRGCHPMPSSSLETPLPSQGSFSPALAPFFAPPPGALTCCAGSLLFTSPLGTPSPSQMSPPSSSGALPPLPPPSFFLGYLRANPEVSLLNFQERGHSLLEGWGVKQTYFGGDSDPRPHAKSATSSPHAGLPRWPSAAAGATNPGFSWWGCPQVCRPLALL